MTLVIPLVLFTILVAGLIVYFLSSKGKDKKSKTEDHKSRSSHAHETVANSTASTAASTAAAAPVATSSKKKKPKSNKPKKAKKQESIISENKFESLGMSDAAEGDDEPEDDDSVASDAIIPSKSAQALLKKSQADAKAAALNKPKKEAEKAEKEAEKAEKAKKEAEKVKKAEEKKKKETAKKEAAKSKKAAPVVVEPVVETAPATEPSKAEESDNTSHLDVTPVSIPHYDGWAVVEDKRKSKQSKKESEDAEESSNAPTPVPVEEEKPVELVPEESDEPEIEIFSQEIEVDSKKLGLLIGPKGVTKLAIQNATATSIQMPKTDKESTGNVTIKISGPAEGVKQAGTALNELIAKGYCTLLVGEDFQEGYVAVHHKFLPDIIGKGGAVIRALNAHTGVKITVPSTVKEPGADGKIPKVKINLAGPKEKVSLTRALIKDLTKYHVTPVTHPGLTYIEMDLTKNYYNYIIGAKGSEIKHIQNSYKVTVHIPDETSVNPNIVIVGEPDNATQAKNHIEKIIDRVNTAAANAAAQSGIKKSTSNANNANLGNGENVPPVDANGAEQQPQQQGGNGSSKRHEERSSKQSQVGGGSNPPGLTQLGAKSTWAAGNPRLNDEPPEEAWTRDFLPPNSTVDIVSMLPTGAKYAPSVPIGPPKLPNDSNPTPSGNPSEPKAPPASTAWNSQW